MSKTFTYLGSDWDVGDTVAKGFRESLLDDGYVETHDGEISFCWGQRRRRDDKTIIFDLGYIDRAWDAFENSGKFYQCSIGNLGWLPQSAPEDRASALPVKLGGRKGGGPIVVCGQVPHDAQHNMDEDTMVKALEGVMFGRETEGREIFWRGHPQAEVKAPWGLRDFPGTKNEMLEAASTVATFNSNIGLESLLSGCEVWCHHSAPYAREANTWNGGFDIRKSLLRRVAYAQWTEWEIRSGACRDYILDELAKLQ